MRRIGFITLLLMFSTPCFGAPIKDGIRIEAAGVKYSMILTVDGKVTIASKDADFEIPQKGKQMAIDVTKKSTAPGFLVVTCYKAGKAVSQEAVKGVFENATVECVK